MVMGLHFYSLLLTEKLLGWLKVAFKPHGIWKKERLDDKMFLTMNMIKVKSVHICLDYLDTFMRKENVSESQHNEDVYGGGLVV